jgi:ABC-type branched-subunit amino acid transport system substrate-binding protein
VSPGGGSGGSGTGGGATTGSSRNGQPIRVGVVGADLAAIGAVFGVSSSSSDPYASVKKIIAYINKEGGIGGRPLTPVFTTVDSGGDASTEQQKACEALTQDSSVDVVMGSGEVLASCLQKKNIAMFDSSVFATDALQMRSHPNWFMPSAIRADRSAAAIIEQAAKRGWLKRGARLGVLVEDCDWGNRTYDNTVVPAARRVGVTLVKGSVKCLTNLVTDLVPITSDVQREALRFSTAGVTDVMAVANAEAFVISQFTSNASQQNYHPSYLVASNAYADQNSASDATVKISADALPKVHGFGTMPLLDVGALARPANAGQAEAQARCVEADPTMLGVASEKASAQPFRKNIFFAGCDAYFMLKQVLEANGVRFSIADVARGYATVLRQQGSSAVLVGGRYSGGGSDRLDGAGLVQPFAWNSSKTHFEYVGPPVAID